MKIRYFIPFIFTFTTLSLCAQEPLRNWSLALGLGGMYTPVYTGSTEYKFQAIPIVDVRYRIGRGELFAGVFDGIGASYTASDWGLTASGGVNFGRDRKSDTVSRLRGSADLENPLSPYLSLDYDSFMGMVSTKIEYYPVSASYPGHTDRDYNAWFLTFAYGIEGSLTEKFSLMARLSLSLMNDDYAQAYYGIEYPTEDLAVYESKAGFHDISFTTRGLYMATDHMGIIGVAKIFSLFPQASKSELSDSPYGGEICFALIYVF